MTQKNSTHFSQISITCAVFGFDKQKLKVLVLRYKDTNILGLPSGVLYQDEDIDFAAHRILKEVTSLKNVYLEQFGTFGKADRTNVEKITQILHAQGIHNTEEHPALQRSLAIGYLALVNKSRVQIQKEPAYDEIFWQDIEKLPELLHDQNQMVASARLMCKRNIESCPIVQSLMPETFTMNELQKLYEIILQESLVRTNFQRWMLAKNKLDRLEKKFNGKSHRAPFLYRFKQLSLG